MTEMIDKVAREIGLELLAIGKGEATADQLKRLAQAAIEAMRTEAKAIADEIANIYTEIRDLRKALEQVDMRLKLAAIANGEMKHEEVQTFLVDAHRIAHEALTPRATSRDGEKMSEKALKGSA